MRLGEAKPFQGLRAQPRSSKVDPRLPIRAAAWEGPIAVCGVAGRVRDPSLPARAGEGKPLAVNGGCYRSWAHAQRILLTRMIDIQRPAPPGAGQCPKYFDTPASAKTASTKPIIWMVPGSWETRPLSSATSSRSLVWLSDSFARLSPSCF